jgi:glycerophosphoryl diester phosphodiesterase
MTEPIVFAHRGASGYAPENTIEAFDLALKMGTRALESDVKLTRDRQLVFYHDFSIGKGTRARPVSFVPLSKLRNYALQSGVEVPTVDEVFAYYEGKDILWSVDASGPGQGWALYRCAKAHGFETQLYMVNEGFRMKIFWERGGMDSNQFVWSIRDFQINHFGIQGILKQCLSRNIQTLNFKLSWLTPEIHAAVTKAGIRVFIWDTHDEESVKAALPYCPEAIYTNYPDVALKAIQEYSPVNNC